jgi:hypothetical protein
MTPFLFFLLCLSTQAQEVARKRQEVVPSCCECVSLDATEPFFVNAGGVNKLDCDKACQGHKTCPGRFVHICRTLMTLDA